MMRTFAWWGTSQSTLVQRQCQPARRPRAPTWPGTLTASLNTDWPSMRRNGSPVTFAVGNVAGGAQDIHLAAVGMQFGGQ